MALWWSFVQLLDFNPSHTTSFNEFFTKGRYSAFIITGISSSRIQLSTPSTYPGFPDPTRPGPTLPSSVEHAALLVPRSLLNSSARPDPSRSPSNPHLTQAPLYLHWRGHFGQAARLGAASLPCSVISCPPSWPTIGPCMVSRAAELDVSPPG